MTLITIFYFGNLKCSLRQMFYEKKSLNIQEVFLVYIRLFSFVHIALTPSLV